MTAEDRIRARDKRPEPFPEMPKARKPKAEPEPIEEPELEEIPEEVEGS